MSLSHRYPSKLFRYVQLGFASASKLPHTTLRLLLLILLFIVGMQPAAAATPQEINKTLSSLHSKLDSLSLSSSLNSDIKTTALDQYQQAITLLEGAENDRIQASEYTDSLTTAPRQIAELQRQLAEPVAPGTPPATNDLAELERELLQQQTHLASLKTELANTTSSLQAEHDTDLAAQLAAARAKQLDSPAVLATVSADNPILRDAAQALNSASSEANSARIAMLQQQMLSKDLRLNLWGAKQRLLQRQINSAEKRVTTIEDAVNRLRQTLADKTAQRIQQRASELDNASDELKAIAAENNLLAQFITQVNTKVETLAGQDRRILAEQERINRHYLSINQQLAVAGAARLAELGAELIKQRQDLSKRRSSRELIGELNDEITRAQLKQLQLEDRRQELADDINSLQAHDPQGHESQQNDLSQLLSERTHLLQDASSANQRYIDLLISTRNDSNNLESTVEEYRTILDSRLFWTPSTTPISLGLWSGIYAELQNLIAPNQGRQIIGALTQSSSTTRLAAVLLGLLAALVLLMKKRFIHLLRRQASYVGKVNVDQALYTWNSLFVSVLMATPGPLFLLALAQPLRGGEPMAEQLAMGLTNAAGLCLLLEIFRQICRDDGLALGHFKWSNRLRTTLFQNLPWLLKYLLPVAILTPILDGTAGGDIQEALRRLSFAFATVVLAVFAHRVLKPVPAADLETNLPGRQRSLQLKSVLHGLGILLPLILLGLSWSGYHFTALELEGKLFITTCMLAGVTLLYYLLLRSVAVISRRLTLQQLLQKRKIRQENSTNRQAAEQAGEGMPDELNVAEVDLTLISNQTKALLRMVVFLLALVLLWQTWSDVLPALDVVAKIQLWLVDYGSSEIANRWVTLGDVLFALALAFLTYFGASNIPGSLEISVLRRANLTVGSSYAITTMVKYLITISGVITVLYLLGVQWSKLQWLVAALSVGLGFGLQEVVANFVSGILILFERPIRVGDTITVGDHTGTVSRIRMRATTLTDWDRKEQIIPNKTLISEQITNWTLSDPITRLVIKVGVAYGSDVGLTHRTLSQAVEENSRVIDEPPPAIFFVGFGDSSLNFEIRVFIKTMMDVMPLTHELHVAIEQKLRTAGIEIPFPQRDVWIRSAVDNGPGSAAD